MRCDTCGTALRDTEPQCGIAYGGALCLTCAPMLSELATQYDELLAEGDGWELLDMDSPEELEAATAGLRAEIAESGDRKAVWPREGM